jgi:(+)-beta-caryophyllene/(+)-caryolan-1-ol synthase
MFSLPDLSVPFTERQNPDVEEAEVHVREYLREFGLLRSEEAKFHYDRTRFGELVGRAYPFAPLPELCIITDWMAVWAIFDDYLERIPDAQSDERFVALIRETISWFPLDPAENTPRSGNPIEVAIRDIWDRLTARSSITWRRRFVRHLTDYLEGCHWESKNRRRGIAPDLARYIETRRRFGGMRPSMDLSEIGLGIELSDDVHAHSRVQKLLDNTADLVLWANDVFSVEAEKREGNVNNIVLVIQRTRGISMQEAADEVAGMLRGRCADFIAESDSAVAFFASSGEFTAEQARQVSLYIDAMKSWIRGNIDWSWGNERYRSEHLRTGEDQPNFLERAGQK